MSHDPEHPAPSRSRNSNPGMQVAVRDQGLGPNPKPCTTHNKENSIFPHSFRVLRFMLRICEQIWSSIAFVVGYTTLTEAIHIKLHEHRFV